MRDVTCAINHACACYTSFSHVRHCTCTLTCRNTTPKSTMAGKPHITGICTCMCCFMVYCGMDGECVQVYVRITGRKGVNHWTCGVLGICRWLVDENDATLVLSYIPLAKAYAACMLALLTSLHTAAHHAHTPQRISVLELNNKSHLEYVAVEYKYSHHGWSRSFARSPCHLRHSKVCRSRALP
jgi:hypothetical protein